MDLSFAKKEQINNILFQVFVGLFCIIMIYPLLWMLAGSLKTSGNALSATLIPDGFNISNYADKQLNIIDAINTSIKDTTNISQKNAEGVKKAAETNQELSIVIDDMAKKADQLHTMANGLQDVVKKFRFE